MLLLGKLYYIELDSDAAERALENMNYQALNGRPMRIMWSHRYSSCAMHSNITLRSQLRTHTVCVTWSIALLHMPVFLQQHLHTCCSDV